MDYAFYRIKEERRRQDIKWGEQNHDDLTWLAILGEEFGEVCQASIPDNAGGWEAGADLEAEIIQVCAVAVNWLESRSRRKK